MYFVEKTFEIASAHKLNLDYSSKCKNLHGHNFKITVYCKSNTLNKNGMVFDFKTIKDLVSDKFDHAYLNEIMSNINPTAENLAKYICCLIGETCWKVDVYESAGNKASYIRD